MSKWTMPHIFTEYPTEIETDPSKIASFPMDYPLTGVQTFGYASYQDNSYGATADQNTAGQPASIPHMFTD